MDRRRRLPRPYRILIALPLAYTACAAALGLVWSLANSGQTFSYYLGSTALSAASAAVYGAAAVLFLLGGRWPRAWLVPLLCGIALVLGFSLSLIWSSAIAGVGYLDRIFPLFDSALLLALYLTVLSAIELRRRDSSQYAQLTD